MVGAVEIRQGPFEPAVDRLNPTAADQVTALFHRLVQRAGWGRADRAETLFHEFRDDGGSGCLALDHVWRH